MAKTRDAFLVRHEYEEMLAVLSDTMAGKLFKALMSFSITGEDPKIPPGLKIIYLTMRNVIIRDRESYAETCERNRQYALKRWHKDDDPSPTEEEPCNGIPTDAEACQGIPTHTEIYHPNPNPNPKPDPDPKPNPNPDPNPNPNPDPDPNPNPDPNPDPYPIPDTEPHAENGSAAAKSTPLEEASPSKQPLSSQTDDGEGSFEPIKNEEIEFEYYGKERNVKLTKGQYMVLSTGYPNETRRHIDLLSNHLKKGKTVDEPHFDYIRRRIEAEERMKRNARFD